jgi:hypothetical protein
MEMVVVRAKRARVLQVDVAGEPEAGFNIESPTV